jgi:hypothetical protein
VKSALYMEGTELIKVGPKLMIVNHTVIHTLNFCFCGLVKDQGIENRTHTSDLK